MPIPISEILDSADEDDDMSSSLHDPYELFEQVKSLKPELEDLLNVIFQLESLASAQDGPRLTQLSIEVTCPAKHHTKPPFRVCPLLIRFSKFGRLFTIDSPTFIQSKELIKTAVARQFVYAPISDLQKPYRGRMEFFHQETQRISWFERFFATAL